MWRNYTSGLFAAVIGAILSAMVSFFLAYSPAKIEIGYTARPALIKLPDEFGKNLKIEYRDTQFSNLSMIEFSILNRGLLQGDINNVELHFLFKGEDGKPAPTLISSSLKGPPSLPDVGIEEEKRDKTSVIYKIQSVRANYNNQIYKASFIFEGDKLPQWTIDTPTSNVRVIDHRGWIDNVLIYLIVAILYLVILVPFIVWTFRSDTRNKYKFLQRFRSSLETMPKESQFTDSDVSKILSVYEEITKPKPYGLRAWMKTKLQKRAAGRETNANPV